MFQFLLVVATAFSEELIPFLLPWDDGSESITDVSSLLEKPAGKSGFIQVKDGHLYDSAGKRFRINGVNFAFSANFPAEANAEPVARRMAKFGINCVRLHHTDTSRSPEGIMKAGVADTQTIDTKQLDKLDYLISQLKKNGIYVDINLKIGREASEADGVPGTNQLPTYDKGPDHFYPRLIELQKKYARDLLTHTNPYTGNRYADEPAVAVIEINNESGLLSQWNNGELDDLPQQFITPLQEGWNTFLKNKYASSQALVTAWSPANQGTGEELLKKGLSGWSLEQIEKAKGTIKIVTEGPNGEKCLKITTTIPGSQGWHLQTKYTPLAVKQDQFLETKVWLKADINRKIIILIQQEHSPWEALDQTYTIDVTTEWKEYRFRFQPSSTDSQARLMISNLANEAATLWIANPSVIDGSPAGLSANETLEAGTIPPFKRNFIGERSPQAKKDWITYLIQKESDYYKDMVKYLKQDLGCKPLIVGTQLQFGTVLSQRENDFIDHHGYWQHPNFPGQSWDSINWTINNISIVNEPRNTIQNIMLNRIDGKAFMVSEYNHPAPNTYSSECIPLLAAYAAFQDWDGIFWFAYSHTNKFANRSIDNFFDIAGHTPKMLAMPIAANILLRGDITPAKQSVIKAMSPNQYIDFLLKNNYSVWVRPMDSLQAPWQMPYLHRTALRIADNPQDSGIPTTPAINEPLTADTQELVWHFLGNNSYVLLKSEKSKGYIGFTKTDDNSSPAKNMDIGNNVQISFGETKQNWANVLYSFMKSDQDGDHWLLTATGYHENEGMIWKSPEKNSVGNKWGNGSPLVEPIPMILRLQKTKDSISLYTLDEKGQRQKELTDYIQLKNGQYEIDLMNKPPALWYEVLFAKSEIRDATIY